MSAITEYSCDLLTMAGSENAARLNQDVFLADEPTTCRHAPDPGIFLPDALRYVRYLAKNGLSFVARDTRTDELIGFIFCFDMAMDPESQGEWMKRYLAHFADAVVMIDELEDRYLDCRGMGSGSTLHIFQIGVRRKYRRSGIASSLICRALDHGRERGFRQAVADCTSTASCRTFEQCGFSRPVFSPTRTFPGTGSGSSRGLRGVSP